MMTTKSLSVTVIRTDELRSLAEPLDPVQERYLQILGLSQAVFSNPCLTVSVHAGDRTKQRRGAR
jgi:hypothetical protein